MTSTPPPPLHDLKSQVWKRDEMLLLSLSETVEMATGSALAEDFYGERFSPYDETWIRVENDDPSSRGWDNLLVRARWYDLYDDPRDVRDPVTVRLWEYDANPVYINSLLLFNPETGDPIGGIPVAENSVAFRGGEHPAMLACVPSADLDDAVELYLVGLPDVSQTALEALMPGIGELDMGEAVARFGLYVPDQPEGVDGPITPQIVAVPKPTEGASITDDIRAKLANNQFWYRRVGEKWDYLHSVISAYVLAWIMTHRPRRAPVPRL